MAGLAAEPAGHCADACGGADRRAGPWPFHPRARSGRAGRAGDLGRRCGDPVRGRLVAAPARAGRCRKGRAAAGDPWRAAGLAVLGAGAAFRRRAGLGILGRLRRHHGGDRADRDRALAASGQAGEAAGQPVAMGGHRQRPGRRTGRGDRLWPGQRAADRRLARRGAGAFQPGTGGRHPSGPWGRARAGACLPLGRGARVPEGAGPVLGADRGLCRLGRDAARKRALGGNGDGPDHRQFRPAVLRGTAPVQGACDGPLGLGRVHPLGRGHQAGVAGRT